MKKITILFSLLFVLYACDDVSKPEVSYKITNDTITEEEEETVEENIPEEVPIVAPEHPIVEPEQPLVEPEPELPENPIVVEPEPELPEPEPIIVTYTITYNNSGNITTKDYEENTIVTLQNASANIIANDNTAIPITFLCWKDSDNIEYYSGNTLCIVSDITLTAVYDMNVLTKETNSGYVFYDKGYYSDGWRYIECAKTDNFTARWWDTIQYVFCNLTSANTASLQIGAGKSNSETIIANSGTLLYMAAGRLPAGWYLPSLYEIAEIQSVLVANGKGNFTAGAYYWSSNEVDLEKAYAMIITGTGSCYQKNKYSNEYLVRGIRYF